MVAGRAAQWPPCVGKHSLPITPLHRKSSLVPASLGKPVSAESVCGGFTLCTLVDLTRYPAQWNSQIFHETATRMQICWVPNKGRLPRQQANHCRDPARFLRLTCSPQIPNVASSGIQAKVFPSPMLRRSHLQSWLAGLEEGHQVHFTLRPQKDPQLHGSAAAREGSAKDFDALDEWSCDNAEVLRTAQWKVNDLWLQFSAQPRLGKALDASAASPSNTKVQELDNKIALGLTDELGRELESEAD